MSKLILAISVRPKVCRLCFAFIKGDNLVLLVYIRIITYVTLTQLPAFSHFNFQSVFDGLLPKSGSEFVNLICTITLIRSLLL